MVHSKLCCECYGRSMLKFYIFRGKRMKEDYIRHYKPKTCMTMQSKVWMVSFFFKKFHSFFKRSIPKDILQSKLHLLVLDGHGAHLTLEAIKQTQQFGLNMVTLPFHTSHDILRPLDVRCFKPFKTTFRNERNNAMVKKITMKQRNAHLMVR